jgi:prevent-host-death family protein
MSGPPALAVRGPTHFPGAAPLYSKLGKVYILYMAETVTLTDARTRLGNLVAKSHHGGEIITITQHGTPVAAIVPYEVLEYFRRREDEADIALAERILAEDDTLVPHDEVAKLLGEA